MSKPLPVSRYDKGCTRGGRGSSTISCVVRFRVTPTPDFWENAIRMDIVRDLGELTELAAEIPGGNRALQEFRPAPGDGFSAIFPLGAAGTPEPGSIFALLGVATVRVRGLAD